MGSSSQPIAPGVYSLLVDASEFTPSGLQPQISCVQPIFSNRGKDRTIKLKEDYLKAATEYGYPKYSKYREFGYHAAMNWLKGGLPAQLCRLTADNAVKAFVTIGMKVNPTLDADADTASDTVFYEVGQAYAADTVVCSNGNWYVSNEAVLKLEEKYINSTAKWSEFYEYSKTDVYNIGDYCFVDKGNYKEVFKASEASATPAGVFVTASWTSVLKLYDADHYITITLHQGTATDVLNIGKFVAIGSGEDYNGVFLRLAYNTSLSNDLDHAAYTFEVLDYNDKGEEYTIKNEVGDFSLAEIKDLDGDSIWIGDALAGVSSTVEFVDMLEDTNSEIEQPIYEAIMLKLKGRYISKNETDFKKIFLSNVLVSILNKKIILANGSDGDLFLNGKIDTDVRDQLLKDFYLGAIDERVLNFMEIPASFTFDMQGNNLAVSEEVSNFTKNSRVDIFSYHCGKKAVNAEDFYTYRIKQFNFDNRNASLRGGWFRITDPYENKIIDAPVFLTKITDLASSIRDNGVAAVHAGYDEEGVISAVHVADSLAYSPSLYYQEKFYMKQVNHPIKDPDGMYYLSTRTLQRKSSKLSMEFAVQVDQKIMIDTLLIGRRFIDKFITDETLDDIKTAYKEYFDNNWLTTPAVSKVDVTVESTPYDRKNNTARAYFVITFNNILEKLVIVRTIK